ncbi:hypothetical protein ABT297_19700 [Dactylosporangium sp. NPDC000555]|uniref:hypothetical protein n=1 Tax=Dactylosporangium sp. NPDC000555 TaxID=3154260 RepID=UPI00332810D8
MADRKDRSRAPSPVEVIRTAVIWFVIGGLGVMALFYGLNFIAYLVLPDRWLDAD